MVSGELLQFMSRSISGDMIYTSATPNIQLGGFHPSRETIPLSLVHPKNAELDCALLEIGVIVPRPHVHWRVKVNGISVTKEFKPHVTAQLKTGLFAKLVYDITSILKTPEGLRRRRVNVTFKQDGGEHIVIDHIGILALYKSDEAYTDILYLSGALSIEPGEEYSSELRYPRSTGVFSSTVFLPSKYARGSIVIDDRLSIPLEGFQGYDEVVSQLDGISPGVYIKIIHEEPLTQYFPKEMRVSNILVYNTRYKTTKLELVDVAYDKKGAEDVDFIIKLANTGETRPDMNMVVIMYLGNVVARKIFQPIEPGQERRLRVSTKLPKGEYDIVVRTIWRKLSKTWFEDRKLRIKI